MRQMPEITTRDRVMGTSLTALQAFLDPCSYLAMKIQPEFGDAEDGREQRGEEKNPKHRVSGDLPHEGSVDG